MQDALFMVQQNPKLITNYTNCILTPNAMEFRRLWKACFTTGPPPFNAPLTDIYSACSKYLQHTPRRLRPGDPLAVAPPKVAPTDLPDLAKMCYSLKCSGCEIDPMSAACKDTTALAKRCFVCVCVCVCVCGDFSLYCTEMGVFF